jgi:protein-disulfide isomerase
MTQSRPSGQPSLSGKNAPPTSRRSARQQRLASREANRRLTRAGSSGGSGGGFGGIMLWTVVALVVGVVVVGGALLLTNQSSAPSSVPSPFAPHVTTPPDIASSGRTLGKADAPVKVDLWEDYRCTACFVFTMEVEPKIVDTYVKTGKVQLIYHDLIVIDDNPPVSTESRDAANAALCASDQGKFWPYHDWLFTNQSAAEKPGFFTLDRLVLLGKDAGLDMAKFEPCVRDGAHLADVAAEQKVIPSGSQGTPTILVNGKLTADFSYATIAAAIDGALNPSPSPAASASASASPAASATVAPTASPS